MVAFHHRSREVADGSQQRMFPSILMKLVTGSRGAAERDWAKVLVESGVMMKWMVTA